MNTTNIVIVVILIAILIPAVLKSVQHMKGEGDCCGGPKEKVPKKKIDGKIIAKWSIPVGGMHCVNCKNRVEKKLNELPMVVSKVNLDRMEAVLSLYEGADEQALEELIPEYISEVGYNPGDLKKNV